MLCIRRKDGCVETSIHAIRRWATRDVNVCVNILRAFSNYINCFVSVDCYRYSDALSRKTKQYRLKLLQLNDIASFLDDLKSKNTPYETFELLLCSLKWQSSCSEFYVRKYQINIAFHVNNKKQFNKAQSHILKYTQVGLVL